MTIKIKFDDFSGEDESQWALDLIGKNFSVEFVTHDQPDILFYGGYSKKHLKYQCLKINLQSEYYLPPKYYDTDYVIGYKNNHLVAKDSERFFYLSCFSRSGLNLLIDPETLILLRELKGLSKEKFCNFLYYNKNMRYDGVRARICFAEKLARYKPIDCPGKVLHNMDLDMPRSSPNWSLDKLRWISGYKFTIAFENISGRSYVTEKLLHPLLVGSVPIYWGDLEIEEYVDPGTFINGHRFKSLDDLVDYVTEVDRDEEQYQSYVQGISRYRLESLEKVKEDLVAFLGKVFSESKDQFLVARKFKKKIKFLLWFYSLKRFFRSLTQKNGL